jgi:hypothetical protein
MIWVIMISEYKFWESKIKSFYRKYSYQNLSMMGSKNICLTLTQDGLLKFLSF